MNEGHKMSINDITDSKLAVTKIDMIYKDTDTVLIHEESAEGGHHKTPVLIWAI